MAETAGTPLGILDTTKKAIGIDPAYDVFDTELVMHINSVFSALNQLGVGPSVPFRITGKDEKWSDFSGDNHIVLAMVESYMSMKVRIMFDPPATSFGLESMNKVASEYEWRLHVEAEGGRYANIAQPK